MIQTREDLKFYLEEDRKRYNLRKNNWIHRFFGIEQAVIWHIQYRFRLYEYSYNNRKSVIEKLIYYYRLWRYQRLSIRYGVRLYPNVIGYGLKIWHIGGVL